jgi:hypothetical protein
MHDTRSIGVPRKALSSAVAGALALAGTITLVASQTAVADETPYVTSGKVYVCKYVGKPHNRERLQTGGNPIWVNWHAADRGPKDGKTYLGETFADAHDWSVVIQLGGSDPGIDACKTTAPPSSSTTTTKPPKTTPPATETTKPPKTSTPVTTPTTGGGGGGVAPGVGAPDTGGTSGGTSPVGGLVGGGLLLAAGGVLVGEALRRRRALTEG